MESPCRCNRGGGPVSNPCMICKGTERTHLCSKNGFDLYRCSTCGLVRVDPLPAQEEIDRYYTEAYNQYRYSFNKPLADPARRRSHNLTVLERFCVPSTLLDVGSAYGHFMQNAKSNGWKAQGVEPLNEARILTQSRFRLPVFASLKDAPSNSFNAATMWHVIEHIPQPMDFLQDVRSKLRDGGILALATPNIDSLSAKATGTSWGWLSPPDHLVLYSRSTLPRLLEQCGFDVLHVETGRGPAKNILLLMLQAIVFRLGLFNTMKQSVQKAAYEYQSARTLGDKINVFVVTEKLTEGLTFLLSPLLALLWKAGLGDEVLVVARKRAS